MKLTEEEKELIIEKRKKEELNKPYKIGYLAHDLYYRLGEDRHKFDNWLFTQSEYEAEILSFKDRFELIEKGTEFTGYLNADGNEEWYDCGPGCIEVYGRDWADKHLERIKIVRKVK